MQVRIAHIGVWGAALGYFVCYVPYSALTKAISAGEFSAAPVQGLELLPITVMASVIGVLAFLGLSGWWRDATRHPVGPFQVPGPGPWTLLSGLCTAAIIATTTLAYTFDGVSIVFMMLLMRGGVLIIAPVVDAITGRPVRWFSVVALLLSLAALVAAFSGSAGFHLTLLATVDVLIYVASYFVRLRFMSRLAKSDDAQATRRYFVEEQMVAAPTVLLALAGIGLLGTGPGAQAIRDGFLHFSTHGAWVVFMAVLVGLFSQGTGIFGGLILLGRQENTFCVPVNRASSILAGVFASVLLAVLFGRELPGAHQLAGAGLVIAAVISLSVPPLLEERRRARVEPVAGEGGG